MVVRFAGVWFGGLLAFVDGVRRPKGTDLEASPLFLFLVSLICGKYVWIVWISPYILWNPSIVVMGMFKFSLEFCIIGFGVRPVGNVSLFCFFRVGRNSSMGFPAVHSSLADCLFSYMNSWYIPYTGLLLYKCAHVPWSQDSWRKLCTAVLLDLKVQNCEIDGCYSSK